MDVDEILWVNYGSHSSSVGCLVFGCQWYWRGLVGICDTENGNTSDTVPDGTSLAVETKLSHFFSFSAPLPSPFPLPSLQSFPLSSHMSDPLLSVSVFPIFSYPLLPSHIFTTYFLFHVTYLSTFSPSLVIFYPSFTLFIEQLHFAKWPDLSESQPIMDAPITHWPIIGRPIIGAKQSADYRPITD